LLNLATGTDQCESRRSHDGLHHRFFKLVRISSTQDFSARQQRNEHPASIG
jgi:hypothetical protein